MISDLASSLRVVLLDIEGTTTPISFVHETLFNFARERLDSYLEERWQAAGVPEIVQRLSDERAAEAAGAPDWNDTSPEALRASLAAYVRWLMDQDRKSPGLKELQGLIWEAGYKAGILRGAVWEDVPRAIERWRAARLLVAIYSSGSELAQRRLFGSTAHGDLTPDIAAFFDTRVGGKLTADSYRRIAAALSVSPDEMCFVSDVTAELRAAREAGCVAVLSARPGNPPQPDAGGFPKVTSFDEL